MTLHPCSAKVMTVSLPMPPLPPVTTAVVPHKLGFKAVNLPPLKQRLRTNNAMIAARIYRIYSLINLITNSDQYIFLIEISILVQYAICFKNQKQQQQKTFVAKSMSAYPQIAAAFNRVGLNENNLATQHQILSALDAMARNNGINDYDRNLADQLWQETQKNNDNQVYVRDFIGTIVKGQELVKSSIRGLENQIRNKNDPVQRQEALQDLASYTQDLRYLTVPFGGNTPRQSKMLEQSGMFQPNSPTNNLSRHSTSTVIFARQIPEKQSGSSTDLKVAFILTAILTFLEVIIMFHKHHFYSLLAYLSVFAIFFLGYFDLHYMRFVKINLLVSVILDLAWLIVNFGQYWNPRAQTQHSSLQWGFLKFILFFILAMMFFKVVLVAILFKYRNNPNTMRRTVNLCGSAYRLNAAPRSPIANIVNGTHNFPTPASPNVFNNQSGYSHYENSY